MDVFTAFHQSDYEFLQIDRGTVEGNKIVEFYEATGVFKLRNGMVVNGTMESRQSDATIHIKTSESFVEVVGGQLVGHGIRCQGQDYEIVGQTGGQNYHDGTLEHYRLTLQVADFVEPEGESS